MQVKRRHVRAVVDDEIRMSADAQRAAKLDAVANRLSIAADECTGTSSEVSSATADDIELLLKDVALSATVQVQYAAMARDCRMFYALHAALPRQLNERVALCAPGCVPGPGERPMQWLSLIHI